MTEFNPEAFEVSSAAMRGAPRLVAPRADHSLSASAGATARATDWKVIEGAQQSGLSLRWSDGEPVLPPIDGPRARRLWAKRCFDIVGATLGLLVLLPVLVMIALSIRLGSPGPILFRQQRTGRDGRPFAMLKFRTMYTHASDHGGTKQARAGDDRITPIGRLLRSKSLDELPQLVNVLNGTMSIVGPRPHVPGMLAAGVTYESLVPYYPLRQAMTPGITGWAQVNGLRGPTTERGLAVARVDHDLAYIQNFSMGLDLKIILITLWRELTVGTGV